MGKAAWHNAVDDLLHFLANKKTAAFVQLLQKNTSDTKQRLVKLSAELGDARAAATAMGVDVDNTLELPSRSALDGLSLEEAYTNALIEQACADLATHHGPAIVMASGTAGATCVSAAAKARSQLARRVATAAAKLGLQPGQHWTRDEYEAAATTLRNKQLEWYQRALCSNLRFLRLLRQPPSVAEVGMADRDTRMRHKQLGAQRKVVQQLAIQWQFWDGFAVTDVPGSHQPGQVLQVEALEKGTEELPWPEGGAEAAPAGFALWYRHHSLLNEVQRCREQLCINCATASNALAYYGHQQSVAHSACARADAMLYNAQRGLDSAAIQRSIGGSSSIIPPSRIKELACAMERACGEKWIAQRMQARVQRHEQCARSAFAAAGLI
jgi:hypothetical protein